MRKGCDGGEMGKKKNRGKSGKKKRMMKTVATTSLPGVDHPNANRWNAARSCQFQTDLTKGMGSATKEVSCKAPVEAGHIVKMTPYDCLLLTFLFQNALIFKNQSLRFPI